MAAARSSSPVGCTCKRTVAPAVRSVASDIHGCSSSERWGKQRGYTSIDAKIVVPTDGEPIGSGCHADSDIGHLWKTLVGLHPLVQGFGQDRSSLSLTRQRKKSQLSGHREEALNTMVMSAMPNFRSQTRAQAALPDCTRKLGAVLNCPSLRK